MKLISIDPSSSAAGFAYFANNRLMWAKTIVCKKDNLIDRMIELSFELQRLLNKHKPDYIAIETPYLGLNRAVSMKMGQIYGMFISACVLNTKGTMFVSKDIISIHPMTAKRAAGLITKVKRAEGKKIVLARLNDKFPKIEIADDNSADAIAVGLAAIEQLKKEQKNE